MLTVMIFCTSLLKHKSKYLFLYRIWNQKKKTELNELDELIYSKSLTQKKKLEKKTELNELSELEYWKTPSQMSSYAHWHAFLYLHAQTSIKTFIHFSDLKSEKKLS